MIIFKAQPNGRIATNEFPMYPINGVYECQGKAWMDERCINAWIDQILAPYVETRPEGVVPIILLDRYRCDQETETCSTNKWTILILN